VPFLDDPLVDVLDRPHVHTAGGLGGHDELGLPGEFPGDDQFLLVATRQVGGEHVDRGRPDVVLLHQLLGVAASFHPVHDDPPAVGAVVIGVQNQVLGEIEVEHETVALAVLGDVSHPCSMAVTRGCVGDLFSVQSDRPGDREEQAGDGFDQLRLAVALHSGHTHDLARLHLEAYPVHGTTVASVDYYTVPDPTLQLPQ